MQVKAAIDQIVFQLTAPHGGRQGSGSNDCRPEGISTHGPTRGPTGYPDPTAYKAIFQLTAPHGGRLNVDDFYICEKSFQLTAPHGGRHLVADIRYLDKIISTHGPTRGPTISTMPGSSYLSFQLTAPHGGRPERGRTDSLTGYFNSRPHTGADL